ncbi:histidine kinase [Mucilaginibacter sp. UR6-1]|uniref:sensor histidine kinase n=1 Tax=Mucilaginibacter sp. UR6-1 TaxID=1435643 RepID=UPI001E318C2B|nr:ATP-binding protein [Mucilaginibacter sp. UR6-1]MCC8407587.1 histidine kinase [Mucilaginibacter sp. UR6-1]
MYFFVYIGAFLLLTRLRTSVKYTELFDKWNQTLRWAAIGVAVSFFLFEKIFPDEITPFLGPLILGFIVAYTLKEPDFKPLKSFINTHLPLVIVGFLDAVVDLITPKFYAEYDDYFQIGVLLAFLWIFARWASTKKQQQELRMMSVKKDELEAVVAERTAELTKQRNELQDLVKELKATQAQLIQSEKMASLGELTAGIAHEIQNPLNFVNNFSEVSAELIDEMEEELEKGDKEEALAIAADIKQNLEKIRHHGKRADGIVKGMLQHSRQSNNVKEATDINKLADEYLRLAYHGLRAKDKSFNAELITRFSENLPLVEVLPQDVGRVLLNLFTNAFYATQQKQKQGDPKYRPVVEVATIAKKGMIEVFVRDNGTGIPEHIKDKIMQPFFTTKPTGEGTGLGLSLSYDIIVKGHNGKIDVQTKEGEYTEFVICIPLSVKN